MTVNKPYDEGPVCVFPIKPEYEQSNQTTTKTTRTISKSPAPVRTTNYGLTSTTSNLVNRVKTSSYTNPVSKEGYTTEPVEVSRTVTGHRESTVVGPQTTKVSTYETHTRTSNQGPQTTTYKSSGNNYSSSKYTSNLVT